MFNLTADRITDSLMLAAMAHGGGTIPAQQFDKVPASGYVVAYDGGISVAQLFMHHGSRSHRLIVEFVESNLSTVVFNPRHYFGSWVHDGSTYIDVVRVFSERAQAEEFARANKQRAIYDLAAGTDIPVRINYRHRNRSVAASMQALDAAMAPAPYVTPHGIDVRTDYVRAL